MCKILPNLIQFYATKSLMTSAPEVQFGQIYLHLLVSVRGHGGDGQVVSVLAFTPTIRVRIPLTPTIFAVKFVFEKNKI